MEKAGFKLALPEWVAKTWCVACYLIINWKISELVERIQFEPGEKFYRIAADYLYEYAYNNKMPPEDIAPTIMNLAEDFLAGNPVKFRAGDYIAMQTHIRNL